ncbi:hypothetical protein NLI96_g8398 [Meripilus lineatus]|uniref:DNA 3'-5' helicase n=1 Tax=Meripilus lineatus TaxID=2056292 RepID=A0AAD5UZ00_9APHY|nr:hypothetical protein NLI96_g8398 [Physisporinus lineatus]
MAATSGWSSPAGLRDLKALLTRLLRLQWPQGPHEWQVRTTARVLDGIDQFVVVACGGGKTAVSYLPILVLKELARDTSLPRYGVNVPADPVMLFIGPLSDLSIIQVSTTNSGCTNLTHPYLDSEVAEMKRMGIKGITLESGTSYGEIPRLRARIPPKVPCAAVTATSRPGKNETKLFDQLNFRCGSFEQTRQSNERTNIYKAYQTLTHGLSGPLFPDIAWVSKHKEKTIIYCRQMKICALVADYLRAFLPPGPQRDHCIRQYHSLLPQERNLDTLHAFENDPDVFCVVATIKFGMGLDARRVKFVVILGLPTTVETAKQEEGRVARDQSMDGMAITYVEMSVVAGIQAEIKKKNKDKVVESEEVLGVEVIDEGEDENLSDDDGDIGDVGGKESKRTVDSQIIRMVRSHVMGTCLVAEDNRIFGNQGPLVHLNCIEASRRLRCSSCLSAAQTSPAIMSHPAPTRRGKKADTSLAQPSPVNNARTHLDFRLRSKCKQLTKKMKAQATTQLWAFAQKRWHLKDGPKYYYLPYLSFFPDDTLPLLLKNLHHIRDRKTLTELLAHWAYLDSDGHALYGIITKLNALFDAAHEKTRKDAACKRKATLAKKKADAAVISKSVKLHSSMPETMGNHNGQSIPAMMPQFENGSQPTIGNIENTPPNSPRKSRKRPGSSSQESRKRRREM